MNDKPKELEEHSAKIFELGCMERPVYLKEDVDAAIAELKQKLQDQCISCPVKKQEDDEVAEKDNEIRRLKRALWLARAMRASSEIEHWKYINRFFNGYRYNINHVRNVYEKRTPIDWLYVWNCVERKCIEKAEEYL